MKGRWKGSRFEAPGFSQKASKAFKIVIELNYVNQSYELKTQDEYTITDQGLLLVGQLIPKDKSLPAFSIRWDEKDDHLNVDMQPHEDSWTSQTNGYLGHHPPRVSTRGGRNFNLVVKTPAMKVIDAVVSFNLTRDANMNEAIGMSDTASVVVKHQGKA